MKDWEGDEDAKVVQETLGDLVLYTTVDKYAKEWVWGLNRWPEIRSIRKWSRKRDARDAEMRRIWKYLRDKYDGNKDLDSSSRNPPGHEYFFFERHINFKSPRD